MTLAQLPVDGALAFFAESREPGQCMLQLAIGIAQVINVFLCRHPQQSAWRFRLFSNPMLLAGLALELALLLLIIYTPWGNALFGTAPLVAEVWLLVLPLALLMGLLEEGRKAFVRWQLARRGRK